MSVYWFWQPRCSRQIQIGWQASKSCHFIILFVVFILEWKNALCHNLFHLVDDSFFLSKAFYLLDLSSATRFFILFDGESGYCKLMSGLTHWRNAFFIWGAIVLELWKKIKGALEIFSREGFLLWKKLLFFGAIRWRFASNKSKYKMLSGIVFKLAIPKSKYYRDQRSLVIQFKCLRRWSTSQSYRGGSGPCQ